VAVGIKIQDGDLFFNKSFGDSINDSDVIDTWNVFVNVDDMIHSRIKIANTLKDLVNGSISIKNIHIEGDFILQKGKGEDVLLDVIVSMYKNGAKHFSATGIELDAVRYHGNREPIHPSYFKTMFLYAR
jgi:hypothetical protein